MNLVVLVKCTEIRPNLIDNLIEDGMIITLELIEEFLDC
jgi:hypothetical protein